MAFKDRLKEARIEAKLTQEQLANGIGVAKSTLAGYESGNREPNMMLIQRIMSSLDVDANFLFQDEMNSLTELIVDLDERNMIKRYRELDDHGKRVVDLLLSEEYERCSADPAARARETVRRECEEMDAEFENMRALSNGD